MPSFLKKSINPDHKSSATKPSKKKNSKVKHYPLYQGLIKTGAFPSNSIGSFGIVWYSYKLFSSLSLSNAGQSHGLYSINSLFTIACFSSISSKRFVWLTIEKALPSTWLWTGSQFLYFLAHFSHSNVFRLPLPVPPPPSAAAAAAAI